ncbi:MAG: hypothetical protein ABS942_15540 [Solibacillus sp.]|uniref:hypothetical protein n=1 Tax=Solibacillus sp. FSL H8-0523 TaxID=2954511 RepID=UPI003100D788
MGIFGKKEKKPVPIAVPIIEGLPIPLNALTKINVLDESVVFVSDNNRFELSFIQLLNIHHTNTVDIQKQISSSIGGAVGGFVFAGPLGAMIGGRSKEKTIRNLKLLLIFEYQSTAGEIKYISFDVTHTPKSKLITMENLGLQVKENNVIL